MLLNLLDILKEKDKDINEAMHEMNKLKKENENMKNILYENEDYNKNMILKDK